MAPVVEAEYHDGGDHAAGHCCHDAGEVHPWHHAALPMECCHHAEYPLTLFHFTVIFQCSLPIIMGVTEVGALPHFIVIFKCSLPMMGVSKVGSILPCSTSLHGNF